MSTIPDGRVMLVFGKSYIGRLQTRMWTATMEAFEFRKLNKT